MGTASCTEMEAGESFPSSLNFHGGLSIELLGQGQAFFGLGAVSQDGVPVRSGRRPMFIEIRNPSGVELLNYRVTRCEISDDCARLSFSMDHQERGLMEWMLHAVRPRYNTRIGRAVRNRRGNHRRARTQTYTENNWKPGISRFFVSLSLPQPDNSHLQDSGSRQLGNWRKRNWQRVLDEKLLRAADRSYRISKAVLFDRTDIPDCANPNAFQFLPLQTEFQGFCFVASDEGVLVTWSPEVSHIRSLFEKARDDDVFVHFHEHCGDLGSEFSTAPMEVLWFRAHEPRSIWRMIMMPFANSSTQPCMTRSACAANE